MYCTVCGPRPDGRGLVGLDGCEVRLCHCVIRVPVCPVCVPALPLLPPVSSYRFGTCTLFTRTPCTGTGRAAARLCGPVLYCNVEPVFGGLWARNVSIGGRAVADRKRGA